MEEAVMMVMAVTQCEPNVAEFFLGGANNDPNLAIENFFAYGGAEAIEGTQNPQEVPGIPPEIEQETNVAHPNSPSGVTQMTMTSTVTDPFMDVTQHLGDAPGSPNGPRPAEKPLPLYVRQSAKKSFRAVCAEAKEEGMVLIVLFHRETIRGWVTRKAFWELPESILSDLAICFDADINDYYIAEAFHGYKMKGTGPMYLVGVDPVTTRKVFEVPLLSTKSDMHVFDVKVALNAVTQCLLEYKQHQFTASGDDEPDEPELKVPKCEHQTPTHAVVRKTVPAVPPTPAPPTPDAKTNPEPPQKKKLELPEVLSLEPFESLSVGTDHLKLRLMFPKGPLDVTLAKSTPLRSLMGYIAHRLRRETNAVEGDPVLLAGRPPKPVEMPNNFSGTIADLKGIRSGDMLMLKLQTQE